MVAPNSFTVEARNGALVKTGDLGEYTSLSVTPRRNAIGAWQLVYPESSAALGLISEAGGIRVLLAGATEPILTGPISKISPAVDDNGGPEPTVTITGTCDNKHLANRLCWPMPTNDLPTQDSSSYYNDSAHAETAMRALVNLNAGPGALARRRTFGLALAPVDGGRGTVVPVHVRFDQLLTVLADLAIKGGDLSFRVKQLASGVLTFDVIEVDDVSLAVRFSTQDGSLQAWAYDKTAPTVTAAILGDSGADTGRLFVEYSNDDDVALWGQRIETFVDEQATADPTQIAKDATSALTTGAASYSAVFTPLDGPQSRYGIDYGVGSLVTIDLGPGRGTIVQVVQEATITDSTDAGLKVVPVVGPVGTTNPQQSSGLAQFIKRLALRVGNLERYR